MTSEPVPAPTKRAGDLGLICVALVVFLSACGGGSERPSDSAWQDTWDRQRAAIPDADTIMAGGIELCAELLGDLRISLPELRPTPTEALDGPVAAWVAHVETIAFECPQDEPELAEQLRTLDLLTAEIEAGLAADSDT